MLSLSGYNVSARFPRSVYPWQTAFASNIVFREVRSKFIFLHAIEVETKLFGTKKLARNWKGKDGKGRKRKEKLEARIRNYIPG